MSHLCVISGKFTKNSDFLDFFLLVTACILRLINKYLHFTRLYCFSRRRFSKSYSLNLREGGRSIDIIIYSGMLNNLSFLSLLIRAEKLKKFRKDRFLNMYLNSPGKGRSHQTGQVCLCTHISNDIICVSFTQTSARLLGKALEDSSCQSSKL